PRGNSNPPWSARCAEPLPALREQLSRTASCPPAPTQSPRAVRSPASEPASRFVREKTLPAKGPPLHGSAAAPAFLLSLLRLRVPGRRRGRLVRSSLRVQGLPNGVLNLGLAPYADDLVHNFAVTADEKTLR